MKVEVLFDAVADALLMGVGFFFGMLYMREQYLRVLEGKGKGTGGSFTNGRKCG